MRVDGVMDGKDGDLTQTENITFNFHWSLAPFFWLLQPLLKKQKEDILHDDTALLERVYELDASGFKRLEPDLSKVVVYGGLRFLRPFLLAQLLSDYHT